MQYGLLRGGEAIRLTFAGQVVGPEGQLMVDLSVSL